MTISSEVRKAGPFIGPSSALSFPFAFKVFAASDIKVLRYAGGVESPLVLDADYQVTLAQTGGTVTLNTPLGSGQRLVIVSNVPLLQPMALTDSGGFYPHVLNDAADRACMQIQQLAQTLGRAVLVPATSDTNPAALIASLNESSVQAQNASQAATASQNAAATSASAAATSASNAAASKTAAANSASSAQTARDAAETHKNKAQAWAENPENTAVESGKYSARHWAAKAQAQASTATSKAGQAASSQSAAAASQSAAATSASNAATSASAAATSASNAAASQTAAANSASSAQTARNAAETHKNKAQAWAENPENTAVESGKYSARHWAAKAQANAASVDGPALEASIADLQAQINALQTQVNTPPAPRTWKDVGAARALNTVYTNTSSQDLIVKVFSRHSQQNANVQVEAHVRNSATGGFISLLHTNSNLNPSFFNVPPGGAYKLTSGQSNQPLTWFEYSAP